MAHIVRKIRKNRWYKTDNTVWLQDGDLQADALVDLQTKWNNLSVYMVDESPANLERVIAAMAVNSDNCSNIDLAIFDPLILSDLGIKQKRNPGDLSDNKVNEWHSDLQELSAIKLLRLAQAINIHARIERSTAKDVMKLVARSVAMSYIDQKRIKWTNDKDLTALDSAIKNHRSRRQ